MLEAINFKPLGRSAFRRALALKLTILAIASLSWWMGYGFIALVIVLLSLFVLIRTKFRFSLGASLLASFSLMTSYVCFLGAVFWLVKFKFNYLAIYILIVMLPLMLCLCYISSFDLKLKLTKPNLVKLASLAVASLLLFGTQLARLNTPYYLNLMLLGGDIV